MILFIFEIKYYHTRTIMILYVVSWFIIRPCGELIFILKIIHFSGLGANLKMFFFFFLLFFFKKKEKRKEKEWGRKSKLEKAFKQNVKYI